MPDTPEPVVFQSLALDLFGSDDADDGVPDTIPILPNRKHVKARDGREFRIEDPQALIDAVAAGGIDLVVGRQHDEVASLTPAPAAGWISHKDLERDGRYGVRGRVQFTDLGRDGVKARHWRYVSPVLQLQYHDGEDVPVVTRIMAASLVNIPALTMASLNSEQLGSAEGGTMNEETKRRLCAAFGLPLDAKEETIIAAAEGRERKPEPSPEPRPSVELAAASALADQVAKLASQVSMLQAKQEVQNFGALPKELRDLAEEGFRAGGAVSELTRQILLRAAPGFAALSTEDARPAAEDAPQEFGEGVDEVLQRSGIDPAAYAKARQSAFRKIEGGVR